MDDLKVKLLLIYTVILSINATDPAAVNRNEVQPIGNVWKEYVAKENGYHKISALHPTLYPPPPGVLIEMEVSIKGPSDGHIMFSEVENPDYSTTKIYEFVVGAGVNSRTDIRFLKGDKIMNTAVTLNILSPDHYTHFRIFIYKDGKMELYKAGKKEAIVSYVDQNQLDMKYFGFGAWTNYVNSFNYTYKMAANPYFTYEPQDVNATEGESAEIRCEAKVKPQPEIKWTHNGKPIEDSPTNDRRTVTSNKITIKNLKVEDTGNYGCNATNALGNVYKEVRVYVQTKPSFTYEPQDVDATEGESAEISCEAKGMPQPEIKWTHNGKPIEDSPTNDRRTVTPNKITIQNLKVEDTGNYGCNATNALGNVYKEVRVYVQTKPSFTYEPQDVDATEGESAEISCEAKGMPQPEIKWTHNGKPIEDSPTNDRRTVTPNKITIQNLKVEDTGNYGCNATNALGNVYKEVRVYVQTKPSFTYEPQDVDATEGESAEISCEAKGMPQPEIKWTHNGKPIEDSPTNDRRTVTSNKITFQNLKVEDTGNYGCNATNALGNVNKEVRVNVQTNKLDGFRVTFGWSEVMKDREHFFTIPRTASEAGEYGFRVVSEIKDELGLQARCLDGDLRVCPLYDTAGSVAGLHIAIPACHLQGIPTDLATKLKLKSINGTRYWTATQYVVSPDIIKAGGRQSLLSTVSKGIWLQTGDQITELPIKEEELAGTAFRKQNCIPNMGTHYYKNISTEANCSDLFPFFLLVKEGQIIGTGFQIFGETKQDGLRPWFEKPSSKIRNAALPNAPTCMGSWVKDYGLITLHIYYVEKPWNIRCEDIDSAQPISLWDKLSLNTLRYASIGIDEAKISTGRILHPNNS